MTATGIHRTIDAVWRIESARLMPNARKRDLLLERAAECARFLSYPLGSHPEDDHA